MEVGRPGKETGLIYFVRRQAMIIDRNFSDYIVFAEDCISRALKKIGRNQHRFIIAVSQSGILEGIMTDGDFRRWVVEQEDVTLTQKVQVAINRKFY